MMWRWWSDRRRSLFDYDHKRHVDQSESFADPIISSRPRERVGVKDKVSVKTVKPLMMASLMKPIKASCDQASNVKIVRFGWLAEIGLALDGREDWRRGWLMTVHAKCQLITSAVQWQWLITTATERQIDRETERHREEERKRMGKSSTESPHRFGLLRLKLGSPLPRPLCAWLNPKGQSNNGAQGDDPAFLIFFYILGAFCIFYAN